MIKHPISAAALSFILGFSLMACNSAMQTVKQVGAPLLKQKAEDVAVDAAVEKATDVAVKSVASPALKTAAPSTASVVQIQGDFDSVVVPEKATKGRFAKKALPDMTGDTRKWAGVKKVTIPRYMVSFDKKAGESASASTGWTGPNANAHVKAKLEGIEEATFERITEKAYVDFEAKMRAAGYEVVSRDTVLNSPDYANWDANSHPKIKKGSSTYLAKGHRSFSQFKQFLRYGKLMSEVKAAVVDPNFVVNFATFGKESRSGFGTANAKVTLGPVVHVAGMLNGTTLNKCDKRGQCHGDLIHINSGQVTYSGQPFGKIEDTTNKAGKAIQGALNVFASLSGTSTRSDTQLTIFADNQAYEVAALEALYEANSRFVAKLKAADKS